MYFRLCNIRSIKENDSKADRRFCFEIQMPNRSLLLQAEDADTRDQWVATMNKAIGFYIGVGNLLQWFFENSSFPRTNSNGTYKTDS